MSDSNSFFVYEDFSVEDLGKALENYFRFQKDLTSQSFETNTGSMYVQAKESSSFKKILGLGKTAQVELTVKDNKLFVTIGQGEWFFEKAGVAIIGQLLFTPLIITSVVGSIMQISLPDDIFSFIERYISTGGKATI